MAWLNEQTWFTYSSNIRLIGNIYISSITHTGTKLRVKGTIAAGARGSSNYRFYYSDYTSYAQPEGGNKIALGAKGRTWKVGDSDVHVDFDVTLSNVAASATVFAEISINSIFIPSLKNTSIICRHYNFLPYLLLQQYFLLQISEKT